MVDLKQKENLDGVCSSIGMNLSVTIQHIFIPIFNMSTRDQRHSPETKSKRYKKDF